MRRRSVIALALVFASIPATALALATLKASRSAVTFSERCVRTRADPKSVRITNDGEPDAVDVRVEVSPSTRAGVFPLSGTTIVPTLEPDDGFEFDVGFVPEADGRTEADAVVSYKAIRPSTKRTPSPSPTARSTRIELTGRAIDRFIDVSPRAVNFGSVRVGRKADTQRVTIYDDGDDTLTIASVSLAGPDAEDFSLGDPTERTVRDGDPTTIEIGFRPERLGARTADLVIRSNSCDGSTFKVPLGGIGVLPDLVLLPPKITFPDVVVGQRSREETLAIVNQGGATLRVTSIEVDGQEAKEFKLLKLPKFPVRLRQGKTIEFFMRFSPKEEGPRETRIVVESNDPDAKILRRKVTAEAVVPPPPPPTASPSAPPPPPPKVDDGFGFPIGRYIPEILVVGLTAVFFLLLTALRRMRGIPE